MKCFSLVVLGLLAACGTPQEQCISRNTRDLRVVNRLISESEANLSRGYALEEVRVVETIRVPCAATVTNPSGLCLERDFDTELRPRAIDLNEEAAKLESLKAKSASLARNAEKVAVACRETYPE